MAKLDYKNLSLDELKTVIADATQEIAFREEATKLEALDKIKAIAQAAGLSSADLAGGLRKSRGAVPVKYRNPDNPGQGWSGRGKRPKWLVDALASGKDLGDLKV